MTRTKKRVWLCSSATVFSVLTTRIWTEHAAGLQMVAYSGIVLGLLVIGFSEDRKRGRFWPVFLLVLVLHGLGVYAGRGLLPVPTTFLLWLAGGIESTLLGVLMVVLLGRDPRLLRPRPERAHAVERRAFSQAGGRVGR